MYRHESTNVSYSTDSFVDIDFDVWIPKKKRNRGELQDAGFPPKLTDDTVARTSNQPTTTSSSFSSSFLRIASIDLKGDFKVAVHSRPLNRDLAGPLVIPFRTLEPLLDRIREDARNSKDKRKGVTTEELYAIVKDFFTRMMRDMVVSGAQELAKGDTVRDGGKKLLDGARLTARDYATDLGRKARDSVHSSVVERLNNMDLSKVDSKTAASLREWGTSMTDKIMESDPAEHADKAMNVLRSFVSKHTERRGSDRNEKEKEETGDDQAAKPTKDTSRETFVDLGDIVFPDFP